ncbi:3-deoxy-7-phosphoheptulonate synthase [Proteiniclasticum sp. SCR006]|uniref:3-deoxy-7-phosphoheptulonate synthase n=1 Tax=Proteiniclasticum aestuarii TaxID=2817862 RepID=A0A939HAI8_9CLOT|nr:3-deoxy-7-phosphoheptulonate synthase [Proteiniclasticum aestuarii]MBO1263753.1 3-deoxy-7-phosphoheptulonate synthase [Proteiniclasticum aestuarii]
MIQKTMDLSLGKVKIEIGNKIISEDPVFFAGPCSVEDLDTMRNIARNLKSLGVDILRGGAFKPRTSPYDFQGLKGEGLEILRVIKKEFQMVISTEILDVRDIEKAKDVVDIIQIGSRNMYNYVLLEEVGKLGKPVILKRGFSATVNEWVSAAEYILNTGNDQVILCERGIRTFETTTRNTLDLNSVAYLKKNSRLPVIVDPSHGTGVRDLVKPMALAGIMAGADGLLIETHVDPDKACSDSQQTIDIHTLEEIMHHTNEIWRLR